MRLNLSCLFFTFSLFLVLYIYTIFTNILSKNSKEIKWYILRYTELDYEFIKGTVAHFPSRKYKHIGGTACGLPSSSTPPVTRLMKLITIISVVRFIVS